MAKVTLTSKSSAMKSYFTLVCLAVIFASCSSVYKTGQTPDDVYFSPERPQDEYVQVEQKDNDRYYSEDEYREDRFLRMRIRDRRWSVLDDGYYGYSYGYTPSYSYLYNSSWSPSIYWNYMYNPYYQMYNPYYYSGHPVVVTRPTLNNRPRKFNLNVFDNDQTNSKATPRATKNYSNARRDNNNYRGSGTNAGSYIRDVFGSSGGSSKVNSSSSQNTRSSSNSTSGSSSSSSSSNSGTSGRGNARKVNN
jgi:hypothetical protein